MLVPLIIQNAPMLLEVKNILVCSKLYSASSNIIAYNEKIPVRV